MLPSLDETRSYSINDGCTTERLPSVLEFVFQNCCCDEIVQMTHSWPAGSKLVTSWEPIVGRLLVSLRRERKHKDNKM